MSVLKTRTMLAVLAPAVFVAALGLSAAPAGAAIGSMETKLTVSRNVQRYSVNMSGVVRMPQAEAQTLLASGYKIQWRLWGDDPVSDDRLFGPDPTSETPVATAQGIEFKGLRVTTGSVLDEDDSRFDDRDELYAGVRLLNASGATVKGDETNRVAGHF